ncbi:hypothetical protein SAMN06272737_1396 [Blastococcus mobilis]|uniref:Uncharacterized protein n=1 Tax=Blastococcus mobilis TaxID=1938746 RepID=A0A239A8H2_9ACTN|nr:hypothetical protein SAMN06272737_1396 [Blastococcus mobilis]
MTAAGTPWPGVLIATALSQPGPEVDLDASKPVIARGWSS